MKRIIALIVIPVAVGLAAPAVAQQTEDEPRGGLDRFLDDFRDGMGDALGGLFFNPAYLAALRDKTVLRLKKERSVFEGKFSVEKLGDFSEGEEELLLASLIMMVLLERDRG